MRKTILVEAGRLPGTLLPAVPLRLSILAKNTGSGQAALIARSSTAARLYGALEAIPEAGPGVVRRHSGGPTAVVEAGYYYLALVDSRGFEPLAREVEALLGARGGLMGDSVVAVSATAGYGYVEVYTPRDPQWILEKLAPGSWEQGELEEELLEEPARMLSRREWLDPLPGEPQVDYSTTTESGYRLRLLGYIDADAGIILETFPDHTIYAYPPGHARMVFREISHVPPADPVAVHTMNALYGGAVVYGAKASEIVEAVKSYLAIVEEKMGP